MPTLLPTADVSTSGWSTLNGDTSLWDNLNNGNAVHRPSRIKETRRVIFWGLDDFRWDDINARLKATSAYRPNERCLETVNTRIINVGTGFMSHRPTNPVCSPARAEWQTGLFNHNNKISGTNGGTAADYTDYYRNGTKVAGLGWVGPHEHTIAASLPDTPVDHDTMVAAGVMRDADDDPQAYTEQIFMQLARRDVTCLFAGKYMNAWTSVQPRLVPPGIEHCLIATTSGSHWTSPTYENHGNNPWSGIGYDVSGTSTTVNYDGTISSASWTSGVARIVCATRHGFSVGDIAGVTIGSTGYTGYDWVVTEVESDFIFKYALATSQSSASSGTYYNRKRYDAYAMATWAIDQLDTLGDSEPFFLMICPHATHDAGGTYAGTYEQLYRDTVDPADAYYYGGTPGAIAPVCNPATQPDATVSAQWQYRQQMAATVDDAVKLVEDYCDARWGTDERTVIFTGDQGVQQREQYQSGDGGDNTSKDYIWEGSLAAPLYITGPDFPHRTFTELSTVHADLPLTVLDLFGFTDHAWHTKRDGVSLLRIVDWVDNDPTNTVLDRCYPIKGTYQTVDGEGLCLANGRKVVRQKNATQTKYTVPLDDYETTKYTPTSGENTAYKNAIVAMRTARWDLTAYENTVRTISP